MTWTTPTHVAAGEADSGKFNEETVDNLLHHHDLLDGGLAIRSGRHEDTVASGQAGESGVTVSYGETFAAAPVVIATAHIAGNVALVVHVQSRTTTGFVYRVVTSTEGTFGSDQDYAIDWVAIGALP